jgi:hypothetical protein
MDPSQLAENRGFFQSAGIYIQTRDDWGPLARYLASTFRPTPAATAVAASVASASGPLIFLSYASEDALTVDRLRETLERHGLRVWLDKQNLRNGQNWRYQIERVIDAVDYFVFVQSEHMEHRGQLRGVYNAELKKAIEHQNDLPHGVVFILHVTLGECQPRPEPELANLHHTNIDSESGMDRLADDICAIHRGTRSLGSTPDGVA